MKTKKKYPDGGPITRQDIKQAKMKAKYDRIQAGTEPSTYEKVATISGNVAKTATAAAEGAKAVRDVKAGMSGPGMRKGGATKKYKTGGMVNANAKVSASKVAKGRPAKSAEPKSAAKKATGRVGGISKAPKVAIPKKQFGGGISGKRADNMVAKGKAVNTYSYPSMERSVTKVKKSGRGDAMISSKDLGKTKKVKG